MKKINEVMTRVRWNNLHKQKEIELQQIYVMKDIDGQEFDKYCDKEAIKYKTKAETIKEYILNSPIWEVAETLTSIEYGKRPER